LRFLFWPLLLAEPFFRPEAFLLLLAADSRAVYAFSRPDKQQVLNFVCFFSSDGDCVMHGEQRG
jgi:hypothetical protein